MVKHVEKAIQKEAVLWIEQTYPDVEVYYYKAEGEKNIITAVEDKRMGLKNGFPDLFLLTDRNDFTYILHLELKKLKGVLNPNQRVWWAKFKPNYNRKGYVTYSLSEIKEYVTNWILSLPQNKI